MTKKKMFREGEEEAWCKELVGRRIKKKETDYVEARREKGWTSVEGVIIGWVCFFFQAEDGIRDRFT